MLIWEQSVTRTKTQSKDSRRVAVFSMGSGQGCSSSMKLWTVGTHVGQLSTRRSAPIPPPLRAFTSPSSHRLSRART